MTTEPQPSTSVRQERISAAELQTLRAAVVRPSNTSLDDDFDWEGWTAYHAAVEAYHKALLDNDDLLIEALDLCEQTVWAVEEED